MFRKVKSKFMLISMIAITFVILLIASCTNIVNYVQSTNSSDEIIQYIIQNKMDKAFPHNDSQFNPNDNQGREDSSSVQEDSSQTSTATSDQLPTVPINFDDRFGKESSYNIRYFTIGKKDDTYFYDLSNIASITQEEATTYADQAFSTNASKGYIGKYRFNKNTNQDFVVFLLCEKDLNAIQDFLFLSILFSGIGLLVSFLFIFIFSGIILKPVKESYDKQKEFITNASHELKTPLTVISTNNELLEITQGSNKYTETISKQISKMTSMTKSLTSLAKLGENPSLEKEDVNLSELISQMVDTFEPVFANGGKTLKADIEDNITIKTNTELISQLLSILLDNACKYTLNTAEIILHKEKGTIIILEKNDVESLQDGDLSRFADRFYRDEGMRSKVAGSGIGLSIAKEIATALQGKMKLYGKDNWFYIQIELK